MNTQGDPKSCTTRETVARIQEFFRQHRRRTIHDVADEAEFVMRHASGF